MFDLDGNLILFFLAIGVMVIGPGYWLYRDTQRRGGNSLAWVIAYAIAAVPPTRLRFLFMPMVFGAWFIWRDRHTLFPKWISRWLSGGRRKTRGRTR